MNATELNIVSLETLDNFFHSPAFGKRLEFRNVECVRCGSIVNIEVEKTSAGYGFLNGIVYEPFGDKFLAQCDACREKDE